MSPIDYDEHFERNVLNFTTEPFGPIKLGVPVAYYRDILHKYKFVEIDIFSRLSGQVEIDGQLRYVKFGVKDGNVRSAELIEIYKQDTFCELPMNRRTKSFQKDLAKAGINSIIDEAGVSLIDYPVGFYSEYGKVASIFWELPK